MPTSQLPRRCSAERSGPLQKAPPFFLSADGQGTRAAQIPENRDLIQQFYDSLAILIMVMNGQLILSAKQMLCLMRGVEPLTAVFDHARPVS